MCYWNDRLRLHAYNSHCTTTHRCSLCGRPNRQQLIPVHLSVCPARALKWCRKTQTGVNVTQGRINRCAKGSKLTVRSRAAKSKSNISLVQQLSDRNCTISINQSKHICIAPYVANESEAHTRQDKTMQSMTITKQHPNYKTRAQLSLGLADRTVLTVHTRNLRP